MMLEYSENTVKILLIIPEPDTFIKEAALVSLLDIVSETEKSYNQLCKAHDEKSTRLG